jgi:hypothetical protein
MKADTRRVPITCAYCLHKRGLFQIARTGMDMVEAVRGRDCSARQITPPGPIGILSFSRTRKCRTFSLTGEAVFLNSRGYSESSSYSGFDAAVAASIPARFTKKKNISCGVPTLCLKMSN